MDNAQYVRRGAEWRELASDYSTSERKTGRKWIDGKEIYCKTVTGTVTVSGNSRAFKVLASGVADLVQAHGFWTGSDGKKYGLETVYGNDARTSWYHAAGLVLSAGLIELVTSSDGARSSAPYRAYVEYTKT